MRTVDKEVVWVRNHRRQSMLVEISRLAESTALRMDETVPFGVDLVPTIEGIQFCCYCASGSLKWTRI